MVAVKAGKALAAKKLFKVSKAKGKVTYNKAKGEFVLSRVGNPSSLKLSYKYPTGLFKGTFKAYIEVSAGRKRAYTANVAGLVVDGKGAGQVTVKGVSGTFPCRIDL